MADVFNKEQTIKQPITADLCSIVWDGETVTQAMQFQLTYSQQISRRRSIGSEDAIIYGSQPQGQITIARLMCDSSALFSSDSWTCRPGTLTFQTATCEGAGGVTYTANGCMVSQYSVTASAEDLTVVDNVVVEFLELTTEGAD